MAAQFRRDAEQQALREALIVPWSKLQEVAETYVEWHTFVLWIRAITEAANRVPESVWSALDDRCPGFLESDRPDNGRFDWRALEDWIVAHCFQDAKAGGWLAAVTYYAYWNLRTEQAWTLWERSKAAWNLCKPGHWPTFEDWSAEVGATRALSLADTEKGRAVAAMGNVEAERLRSAVSDLLESRAFAMWVGSVSKPQQHLNEVVMAELNRRYPALAAECSPASRWDAPFLFRLVRFGDAPWRAVAIEQGWISALRYHVLHHPRHQRLIHYRERCRDLWSQGRPIAYPSFTDWVAAADAYCVQPAT